MPEEIRPIGPTSYVDSSGNTVNLPASKTGADLGTAAVEVVAAPATGLRLLITGVTFINKTAAAISAVLQQGGVDIFPDMYVPATTTLHVNFPQAIPLSEAEGIDVKLSDTDTANGVIIFGYCDYC